MTNVCVVDVVWTRMFP